MGNRIQAWHPSALIAVCMLQIHLLNSSYVKEEEEFVDKEFQEYERVDEDFKKDSSLMRSSNMKR